jgi:hypothetical protein
MCFVADAPKPGGGNGTPVELVVELKGTAKPA